MDDAERYQKEQDLIFQEMEEKGLIQERAVALWNEIIDQHTDRVMELFRQQGKPLITREKMRARIVKAFEGI